MVARPVLSACGRISLEAWENEIEEERVAKDWKLSEDMAARLESAWPDICANVADGKMLGPVLRARGFSREAARAYRASNPDAARTLAEAQRDATDALFEQLHETIHSPDLDPQVMRTRANSLQWAIEKRDPDRFGARTNIDARVRGTLDMREVLTLADARLVALTVKRAPLVLEAPGPRDLSGRPSEERSDEAREHNTSASEASLDSLM